MKCVQNDMLTIAGEARVQNGTHPKRSRKPSPLRICSVPDSSRRAAGCADSQNFTCARYVRNVLPYRLTFRFVVILRLRSCAFGTGLRSHLTAAPDQPASACMHVQARLIGRSRSGSASRKTPVKPARAPRSGLLCRPGRALYSAQTVSGPENTHLEHSVFTRLVVDECPTRAGFAIRASRKGSPSGKIAVPSQATEWLPKNLTVTVAVSKNPMRSDTYAQKAFSCAPPTSPEKPHLSTEILHTTTLCQPPKNLTCAKKRHSKNEISSSPGGLFGEFGSSWIPKSLTFDHFSGKFHSRKDSPVARIAACDPGPEKSHLNGIRAGKPGFPSRKTSPLGHHRPRSVLLLCKMAFVSRKSSHQTALESRETSPFTKTA